MLIPRASLLLTGFSPDVPRRLPSMFPGPFLCKASAFQPLSDQIETFPCYFYRRAFLFGSANNLLGFPIAGSLLENFGKFKRQTACMLCLYRHAFALEFGSASQSAQLAVSNNSAFPCLAFTEGHYSLRYRESFLTYRIEFRSPSSGSVPLLRTSLCACHVSTERSGA